VADDIPEGDDAERDTEDPGNEITHVRTSLLVSAGSQPHSPVPI
jgi:hypothetical protein